MVVCVDFKGTGVLDGNSNIFYYVANLECFHYTFECIDKSHVLNK